MKKTRWLLYVVFGMVFYLLFLIVQTPASWLAWGLNHYSQGTVRLDPISGSLWGGNGRLVIYYPKTTPHELGQAKWHINPLWLFTGRIQIFLQTSHQDRQITTTLSLARNGLTLKDTDIAVPAAFIAQLYTPFSLISPQGMVRISTPELRVATEKIDGTAAVDWLNAASSLSNVQPLGDYRLTITGAGNNANLKLATLKGDLELTGQGQLSNNQITFTGDAKALRREKELESLMQLMGNDAGSGHRSISINHRLQ